MWIWDGYFNEKRKGQWLETAEQLKHVNPHVLQDIEDAILLEAYKGTNKKQEQIKKLIEAD